MSAVLEVKGLTKNYQDTPDSRDILKDISLTVNHGEFICILGPSGCGKTTLIRCIAGFEDYEGRSSGRREKSKASGHRPNDDFSGL